MVPDECAPERAGWAFEYRVDPCATRASVRYRALGAHCVRAVPSGDVHARGADVVSNTYRSGTH